VRFVRGIRFEMPRLQLLGQGITEPVWCEFPEACFRAIVHSAPRSAPCKGICINSFPELFFHLTRNDQGVGARNRIDYAFGAEVAAQYELNLKTDR
jgi:hypothetical protein